MPTPEGQQLQFTPGNKSVQGRVRIANNGIEEEGNETFTLHLEPEQRQDLVCLITGRNVTEITIIDDDDGDE